MSGVAGEPQRQTRISPSLCWYRDTCNVFVWTAGEQADRRGEIAEMLLEVQG
jgi:hypothetical protein